MHTVSGAHFDWSSLLGASQAMSLFSDRQLIEIRIPGGKPGKDGSEALQRYCEQLGDEDHPAAADMDALRGASQQLLGLKRRQHQAMLLRSKKRSERVPLRIERERAELAHKIAAQRHEHADRGLARGRRLFRQCPQPLEKLDPLGLRFRLNDQLLQLLDEQQQRPPAPRQGQRSFQRLKRRISRQQSQRQRWHRARQRSDGGAP